MPNVSAVAALFPGTVPVPSVQAPVLPGVSTGAALPAGLGFGDLLEQGMAGIDAKVRHADTLMNAYVLGEPIPVHQITIALEQARIAVELGIQVRERLTETYRSFMGMQL